MRPALNVQIVHLSKRTSLTETTAMAKKKKKTKYSKKAQDEVKKAVKKQKKGTQRSGKKGKAKSREQAIAIGLSKARKKGAKVPAKKK